MNKIEITPEGAKAAYAAAKSEETKTVLRALFGQAVEPEQPKDIKERIKTFRDAFDIFGGTKEFAAKEYIEILFYDGKEQERIAARDYLRIRIIAKALNEGWEPNWDNHNEKKYYPWFEASPGGGFRYVGCGDGYSGSAVGSRLCFKSAELAKYAGTQFIDIYNGFLK